MGATKEKTCKDRIEAELKDRLADISEATDSEEKREEFDGQILSVDKKIVYRVCLSWGGPADYFDIELDPEGREIVRISYIFQDWFDGAERELAGQEFDTVASMFDYLTQI